MNLLHSQNKLSSGTSPATNNHRTCPLNPNDWSVSNPNTQNHEPPDWQAAAAGPASAAQPGDAGRRAAAHQELPEPRRPAQSVQVHGAAGVRSPSQTCKKTHSPHLTVWPVQILIGSFCFRSLDIAGISLSTTCWAQEALTGLNRWWDSTLHHSRITESWTPHWSPQTNPDCCCCLKSLIRKIKLWRHILHLVPVTRNFCDSNSCSVTTSLIQLNLFYFIIII